MDALVIKGGTVVTSAGTRHADVLIEAGRIAKIGDLDAVVAVRIDARGMYVMPGAVDAHTHIETPAALFGGVITSDDWRSGTIASACGGTTTVVDFAYQRRGRSLRTALEEWHARADGHAVVDYAFHVTVSELTEPIRREIPSVIAEGVTSFKMFTAFEDSIGLDDAALLRVLFLLAEHGGLAMVHAENGKAIVVLRERLAAQGLLAAANWSASRPAAVEAEATQRAIALASLAGTPIYIVHMSCDGAFAALRDSRARGSVVFGETCPHYLVLTADALAGADGARYVCAPALRDAADLDSAWRALADGAVSVVASDHSPWPAHLKDERAHDFRQIVNGVPGAEERLPLLWTHGVATGRITVERFVELVASGPARILGLPNKGELREGADADVLVWDPRPEWRLTASALRGRADHTIYEGWQVRGHAAWVLSRGRVIVRDRMFVGGRGGGRFLRRAPVSVPVAAPAAD